MPVRRIVIVPALRAVSSTWVIPISLLEAVAVSAPIRVTDQVSAVVPSQPIVLVAVLSTVIVNVMSVSGVVSSVASTAPAMYENWMSVSVIRTCPWVVVQVSASALAGHAARRSRRANGAALRARFTCR